MDSTATDEWQVAQNEEANSVPTRHLFTTCEANKASEASVKVCADTSTEYQEENGSAKNRRCTRRWRSDPAVVSFA
jgi:hypothetical protein